MFYHDKLKQWIIFWRINQKLASCRLQTARGPHMASESEKWRVWSNEKKKWLTAADMVCRLLTVDELLALAPETIIMNVEQIGHCWFEAPGAVGSHRNTGGKGNECYKKTEEMMNGRPVYQCWQEKWQRPVCFNKIQDVSTTSVSNLSKQQADLSRPIVALSRCFVSNLSPSWISVSYLAPWAPWVWKCTDNHGPWHFFSLTKKAFTDQVQVCHQCRLMFHGVLFTLPLDTSYQLTQGPNHSRFRKSHH